MEVIGYIRVSSNKQELQTQEHLLLKYAQQHDLQINDFIQIEVSSRKKTSERRIDELLGRLNRGDALLVSELSRLGRNMFEVINIINQLSQKGVKLTFVQQPELSTAGSHNHTLNIMSQSGITKQSFVDGAAGHDLWRRSELQRGRKYVETCCYTEIKLGTVVWIWVVATFKEAVT